MKHGDIWEFKNTGRYFRIRYPHEKPQATDYAWHMNPLSNSFAPQVQVKDDSTLHLSDSWDYVQEIDPLTYHMLLAKKTKGGE